MANQNLFSDTVKGWQKITGNPLGQAALLGAITLPAAYFLKNPAYRLIRGYSMMRAKTPKQRQQIYKEMNDWSNSWQGKWAVPLLAGSAIPLLSLGMNIDPHSKNLGLTSWDPQPINKNASLKKVAFNQYSPISDFSTTVNPQYLTGMIRSNPVLQDNSYAMNLGASILNAAPATGFNTTLGNVYDAALNKFQKKLNFQGLAGSAVKGVVSGSLAGMFTDVCGAMAGLPRSVTNPISGDIGILTGVGTALSSILS